MAKYITRTISDKLVTFETVNRKTKEFGQKSVIVPQNIKDDMILNYGMKKESSPTEFVINVLEVQTIEQKTYMSMEDWLKFCKYGTPADAENDTDEG